MAEKLLVPIYLPHWMHRADVEVILFGDDEGAAAVCAEFGLRHELTLSAMQTA